MSAPEAPAELLALIDSDRVTRQLPADARQTLARAARIETHARQKLLHPAGEPLKWMRLVLQGHIEIVARHAAGEEVALGDVGPGGWLTWASGLTGLPNEHDLVAAPGTRCLAVPASTMREVFAQHPSIYLQVIADMGVRIRQLMEWTGESVLLGPEQRMAKLIHLLARLHRLPETGGTLAVTQSRLARMARCSRQSANTLLGALEARGLIATAYGRFEVRELKALKAFIDAEPPAR